MESLRQDVRYALRVMTGSPGLSLIVVLALGLGIGANTAIFSVIDAVILRPLPYEDPESLVKVWMNFTGIGLPKNQNWVSAPEFVDLRDQNRCFSGIAAIGGDNFNLKIGGMPEQIEGVRASADFFRLLGVQAQLGRTFLPEEDRPGHENVVVLSHGLWQRRFGGDRSLPGQSLMINGRPHVVVGIAPPGFQFPSDAEIWAPLAFSPDALNPGSRGSHGYEVLARIKYGTSLAQARSDMQLLLQRMIEQNPGYPYKNFQFRIILNPLLDELVGDVRPALWVLMGAVGFVLLIACANVANLLIARATARQREIAIRSALGAGRGRLFRQLLTESVMLAFLGSLVGILLAHWGLGALIDMGAVSFPRISGARLNPTVLVFTMLIAVATGVIFGLAPGVQVSRTTHDSLKEASRASTPGAGADRMRRVLVVGEIALSLALMAGAGLLLRSFFRLRDVDPGFRPEDVLTLRMGLPGERYSKPPQIWNFFREVIDRTARLPGVEAVGGVSALPLSGSGSSGTTTVDSRAVAPQDASPEADWRVVTPGYFNAMNIRLIRGRFFDDRDSESAAPVAIIDETMAKTYWPGEDPIGKRVRRGGAQSQRPWMTIVGVVGHVRYRTLEAQSRVQLYWPYSQNPWPYMSLAVRTSQDPLSLASSIQKAVLAVDPDQPVAMVRTMEQLLAESIARRKFSMFLLAIFAAIALLLAAVGIYGVISYAATQRAHEMGIRMALGSSRFNILRLILSQTLSLAVAGVLLGLGGSLAMTRVIAGLLFNVQPTDPFTFACVSGFLMLVALLAGLVPAGRAAGVDPMVTLRNE